MAEIGRWGVRRMGGRVGEAVDGGVRGLEGGGDVERWECAASVEREFLESENGGGGLERGSRGVGVREGEYLGRMRGGEQTCSCEERDGDVRQLAHDGRWDELTGGRWEVSCGVDGEGCDIHWSGRARSLGRGVGESGGGVVCERGEEDRDLGRSEVDLGVGGPGAERVRRYTSDDLGGMCRGVGRTLTVANNLECEEMKDAVKEGRLTNLYGCGGRDLIMLSYGIRVDIDERGYREEKTGGGNFAGRIGNWSLARNAVFEEYCLKLLCCIEASDRQCESDRFVNLGRRKAVGVGEGGRENRNVWSIERWILLYDVCDESHSEPGEGK
ncbi:hypothetical protein Tco_1549591 [Tanacetum coccineum]